MVLKKKFYIFFIFLIALSWINTESLFPETRDFVKFEVAKGYFKKGFVYYNNMQYLTAVEFFRKAIGEYPQYFSARDYLARSYKHAGFFSEALKEWEILKGINPKNTIVSNEIDYLRFQKSDKYIKFGDEDLIPYNKFSSNKLKQYSFKNPVDIAVDNEKNIYITSFSSGKLTKLDPNGKGLWTTTFSFSGKLYGIDYFKNRLAITDFKEDSVLIIDKDAKILKKFGSPGSGEGRFHGPQGVCFDKTGNIYVVDSGNHRVQKFDDKGSYILKFGRKGAYEGQLNNPSDIVYYKKKLYVTDTNNRRISCFDDSGNFLRNIDIGELMVPRGISVFNRYLVVSDEKKGLLLFDTKNESKKWFDPYDRDERKFSRLISSVADRDGYLYCLDYNKESVFVFSNVQKRYTNLNVEITSVDHKKFPVVAFYTNIRTKDGKPVYGLKLENFKIFEDKAPINNYQIDYLKKKQPSVSLVFCIDRSISNSRYHNDIPWVSDFVLKNMKKNDSVKIINFNENTWVGNKFDWSRRRTLKALGRRSYRSAKKTGKGLYKSISDLLPRINKRAVVLITDGTLSDESFQQYSSQNIIQYAKTHYIPIYIISFKKPHPYLQRIANESGGKLFRPNNVDGLRRLYERIKFSEENRYIILYNTFKMSSFKGWWSDVKLEINYKGQKGVAWGGYFVP
ncbi:VWA domain-containing protein [Spirochaetota bacterium]